MASDDPVRDVATWVGSVTGGGLIGYLTHIFVIGRGRLRLANKTHDQSKALIEAGEIIRDLIDDVDWNRWANTERRALNFLKRLERGEFDTNMERK